MPPKLNNKRETQRMNPQTLDTYMNLFLLVTVIGGIAYAVFHFSRKKAPPPRDAPQRPEGFRPRVKQEESEDEAFHSRPPITDWKELPARGSMHDAIVKPPSFRPVQKPPVVPSRAPKSYKASSTKTRGSSYRSDDVDVATPVVLSSSPSSESPRCDAPTYSGGDSGGSSGGDSGGSCSTD